MVRTMAEIQGDPERVRVTVDVELSGVGTAAQANRIQVLEEELAAAQHQAREWDRDRHTERDRADRMTQAANEQEAQNARQAEEARQSIAARDRLLETATRKVSAARELLNADEVAQARRMDGSGLGKTMAHAIGAALRVLDQA